MARRHSHEHDLRSNGPVQAAASQMLATQARILRQRPDVQWFADQEAGSLTAAERLVVEQHARPSLLLSVLRAGGAALGVAAAVAPKRLQAAIAGRHTACSHGRADAGVACSRVRVWFAMCGH
jgi:demethoxyubiquinone hydroxylase (CLK1/Coq7/Cat5 family)